MALWVDKYRPNSLEKLELHEEITAILKKLCEQDDFPHLLFHGPSGSGKKTRVAALLRELYGSGAEKVHDFVSFPSLFFFLNFHACSKNLFIGQIGT